MPFRRVASLEKDKPNQQIHSHERLPAHKGRTVPRLLPLSLLVIEAVHNPHLSRANPARMHRHEERERDRDSADLWDIFESRRNSMLGFHEFSR